MYATGQIMLWIGFLVATVATVCRLEVTESPWSTIPWGWYALGVFVGGCGVVLLRNHSKAVAEDSTAVEADFATLTSSLESLLKHVGELRSQLKTATPQQVVEFIDNQCAEPFADFADSRNALVQRFGLQAFADVMTQFASGERFVNRAWSAAADGYMEEAAASLERGESHLQRAGQQLRSLTADS